MQPLLDELNHDLCIRPPLLDSFNGSWTSNRNGQTDPTGEVTQTEHRPTPAIYPGPGNLLLKSGHPLNLCVTRRSIGSAWVSSGKCVLSIVIFAMGEGCELLSSLPWLITASAQSQTGKLFQF